MSSPEQTIADWMRDPNQRHVAWANQVLGREPDSVCENDVERGKVLVSFFEDLEKQDFDTDESKRAAIKILLQSSAELPKAFQRALRAEQLAAIDAIIRRHGSRLTDSFSNATSLARKLKIELEPFLEDTTAAEIRNYAEAVRRSANSIGAPPTVAGPLSTILRHFWEAVFCVTAMRPAERIKTQLEFADELRAKYSPAQHRMAFEQFRIHCRLADEQLVQVFLKQITWSPEEIESFSLYSPVGGATADMVPYSPTFGQQKWQQDANEKKEKKFELGWMLFLVLIPLLIGGAIGLLGDDDRRKNGNSAPWRSPNGNSQNGGFTPANPNFPSTHTQEEMDKVLREIRKLQQRANQSPPSSALGTDWELEQGNRSLNRLSSEPNFNRWNRSQSFAPPTNRQPSGRARGNRPLTPSIPSPPRPGGGRANGF